MPNFPVPKTPGNFRFWRIVREHEVECQTDWMAKPINKMRERLGSPDAPVVCVRGNHDFVPIAPIFAGCNVIELVDNEVHEVLGKRITGHRGIPWIYGGWNDEVQRPELIDLMKRMPAADIYVTHYPPRGVLDNDGSIKYGLEEMANHLVFSHPATDSVSALHCFGHIHERGGETEQCGSVLFSNAATRFNVIEF